MSFNGSSGRKRKPFWEKEPFQKRAETLWNTYLRTSSSNARDALVEIYMPLTSMAAQKMSNGLPASVDMDELRADAVLGLLGSVVRWRPERGAFVAYSFHRMRHVMIDGLRERDTMSRWSRMLMGRLSRAKKAYYEQHGCDPSTVELARSAEISHKVCARHLGITMSEPFLSLEGITESKSGNGRETESGDRSWMGDTRSGSDVSDFVVGDFIEWLLTQIEKPRQRRICRMYLLEGLSQREIAAGEGVHETRVCQVLDECRAIWVKRSRWLREEKEARDGQHC